MEEGCVILNNGAGPVETKGKYRQGKESRGSSSEKRPAGRAHRMRCERNWVSCEAPEVLPLSHGFTKETQKQGCRMA